MNNQVNRQLMTGLRQSCCLCIISLLIISGLPNIALATQSDQDEIRAQLETLRGQQNEVDGDISRLSGKPAQLQNFQKALVTSYKNLAKQKLRLKGIRLWNGFVAFISVTVDSLQKVNPGTSLVTNIAGFLQDRASETLSNAPLQAKINRLSSELNSLAPSLQQLDRTLTLTPAEVADLMVARGMVGDVDAIAVRWDGELRLRATPEEIAKSPAVITAKATFITERIETAMRSLYQSKMAANESIVEITVYVDAAKIKSRELGIEIGKLEAKLEYEKIEEDLSVEPLEEQDQPDIQGDIAAIPHGQAFAEIQAAWNALRANSIDGETYIKIKSRMQAASWIYGLEKLAPYSKRLDIIRNFMFNEFAAASRAISDRYARQIFRDRKQAEFRLAEKQYSEVADSDTKVRNLVFFKPLKKLHEEEIGEVGRLKRFSNRVEALYKTPVSETLLDYDSNVLTVVGTPGMITSENLAGQAWAGVIPPRLFNSFYQVKDGRPVPSAKLAREAIRKAEALINGARITSTQLQGILSQAEAMARELEVNLNLWNYLVSAPDLGGVGFVTIPLEWLPTISVSSRLYAMHVNLLRQISMDKYEALKEKAKQVVELAAAETIRNKQLSQAKTVVSSWVQAKNICANNGLDTQGEATRDFLQSNNVTNERIEKIKKNTLKLKNPKDIENYVLKELAGNKGHDPLVPNDEQLKVMQGGYSDLKGSIEKKRIAYPLLYTSYNESYLELEDSLYAAQTRFPALVGNFSVEGIMAEAGQKVHMSNWALPEPDQLPAPDPNDDILINEFIEIATNFNQLLLPYRDKAKKRYAFATQQMAVFAGKPLTTAILQPGISPEEFETRIAVLTAEAEKIYAPLAFLDTEQEKSDLGITYQRLLDGIKQAKEQYLVNWYVKAYRQLEVISTKLESSSDLPQEQRETYQLELNALIAPGSFAEQHQQNAQVTVIIVGVQDLLEKLSAPPVSLTETTANEAIIAFYNNFKQAYEAKNESLVMGYIADEWASADGVTLYDLEDNLRNMYNVFDDIQYTISGLNISKAGENIYNVSYSVTIRGEIYDNDLIHEEVSTVKEQLLFDDSGQLKISRTLGGNYWSIQ